MVETQYKMSIQAWMSDAGGKYTSTAFLTMMKEKGITVLQSVPHAHQQNGHTERLNQTLSDKAESLRLQACLPPSWWEFALDHATHVYNWTPMKRLEWHTPSEWLTSTRPSIDHLRVLGCTAYVFIPAEVRANELSPKSKLMTYLGTTPGGKGWIFMRAPNNTVFTAAQAIFDESMFPKCPASKIQPSTRLQSPAPPPVVCPDGKCDYQGPLVGDDDPLPSKTSRKRSFTQQEKGKAWDDGNLSTPSNPTTPSSIKAEPPTSVAPPQPPARRSGCVHKVPKKEGNVYGDKHPVQIEQDICQKKDWDRIVGEQSSHPHPNVPGPGTPASVPSPPHQPQEGTSSGEEKPDSKSEVEDSLEPSSGSEEAELVAQLAQEGGVHFQHFLVSKAISPNAEDSSPKEWTYRDLLKLPKEHLDEWKAACERELDALNRQHVFDLVERPKKMEGYPKLLGIQHKRRQSKESPPCGKGLLPG